MEAFRQIDISGTIRRLRDLPYKVTVYGLAVPNIAQHHYEPGNDERFYCYEADRGILVYIPAELVDK